MLRSQLEIPFESLKNELSRLNKDKNQHFQEKQTLKISPREPIAKISTLENKIFFSIMNNVQLINKENEEFLITYLPHPLCDIVGVLQEEKRKNLQLGFIQFFELLSEDNQQLVSKILLENQEDIKPEFFDQLLTQLQKKHWKVIVNNIKIKLEEAQKTGNAQAINHIMHTFSELKKKVIGNILPE